jgi:ABC-2 type transport system ATP-binding protein
MIEINKLKFGYKKNKILFDNLNLNLKPGLIHGLLGKNGAGKTTLIKQIIGLSFPDVGYCKVMGHEPKDRHPEYLSDIFVVPEEFELPALKICEFVKLHAQFYIKFDHELFNKCINEFELNANDKIHQLSFGQKKKVMLSFGIATNTRLLILDEPTNSLDIPSKSIFRKIIASAVNEEKTILISTHQVRDLENLIDSVIVLHDGKIVFNHIIPFLTEKLCFSRIDDIDISEDILYSESIIGGKYGIMKNTKKAETRMNIELLFNGIINNYSGINNFLNN